MQELFSRMIEKHTPKSNPDIMNGVVINYMQNSLDYVDSVFKSASESFPKGLEYLGYERCSPVEEFEEVTRPRNGKRQFDLARNDLYMVKYFFRFNGEDLPPRYIYMPNIGEAGMFYIGGVNFHMTPVLSDNVISPGLDTIFVKLLRDKVIFRRLYHTMVVNDERIMTQIVWSAIYRKNQTKNTRTTKAVTCLAHYLFAKYGVTGAFRKYCGFVPVFGDEEITEVLYPKDKWMICESIKMKPKDFMGNFYTPNTIRMAIPKDQWNMNVQALVSGFFYVVDYFPSKVRVKYIDNVDMWMVLLGHIIFSGNYSDSKLFKDIESHFISLSEYVDAIVIDKLKKLNYTIYNFYDLLAVILKDFNSIIVRSNKSTNNVFNKTVEVLYYALYDITSGIFRVNFKLNKLAAKKELTAREVVEVFNKQLKTGAIFSLSSGKIVTGSVGYSGDHKYPKLTSILTEQENLPGATRGKKSKKTVTEKNRIHTSMLEVGSLLFLPKSNPTPVVRVNPFLRVNTETGAIIPNEKFTELLDRTQEMLKGTRSSVNVDILETE